MWAKGLVAVVVVGFIAWLSFGSEVEGPAVENVGYFKSADRDRVMSFRSQTALTEAQAREVFDGITVTGGRIVLAVIYEGGEASVPAEGLTSAASLQEAMALVSSPPFDGWRWRYRVNPAGQRTLDQRRP